MASALGKSIVRNEDERYLRGRGEFVADIKRFGMQHVAFVRSNIAHGLIKNIVIPQKFKSAVFTSEDLKSVRPIRADSQLPGFQSSQQFSIARDKVRFVGEILAVCVAPSRAEAEDIAATISAEIDELPAIFDMQLAKEKDTLKIHEDWKNNVMAGLRLFTTFQHKRIIYASSSTAVEPDKNPYALSKKTLEKLAPFNSLGLRFTTVYGPNARESMLIPMICNGAVKYINTNHSRDFIHVDDVCDAIKVVIQKPIKGVIDIGTGKSHKLLDIMDRFNINGFEKKIGADTS